jgi:hypothetical protein
MVARLNQALKCDPEGTQKITSMRVVCTFGLERIGITPHISEWDTPQLGLLEFLNGVFSCGDVHIVAHYDEFDNLLGFSVQNTGKPEC